MGSAHIGVGREGRRVLAAEAEFGISNSADK